jgi:DNA recombination protein RmuC
MSLELLLGVVLLVMLAGFGVLWWTLRRPAATDEKQLQNMIAQVFGLSANQIAEQSRQLLSSEKDAIRSDLNHKHVALEKLVTQLQVDLRQRQDEIRSLEQDRTKKFGELTASLEQHRTLAAELKISTQQLATVLSNNQTRGEWGERIIEDLLTSNGLIEGVHYLKQQKQQASTLRPDITLLLPNKRTVPVDVKFPFAQIQKLNETDNKTAQEQHLKQFASDLKVKVDKVAEYIDPERQTLDYAILFVPNEMLFSFINQKLPEIIDLAMSKRVMIVSPFTFLIVARTVMESYRNFMISDKLRDVVGYVDEFVKEWTMFRDEFEKFGRSIDTLKSGYEKLTTTRSRQLDRKIEKIEAYRGGSGLKLEG